MNANKIINNLLINHFRWVVGVAVGLILVLGYQFALTGRISELQTSGLMERAKVENELAVEEKYLADLRASIDEFDRAISAADLADIDAFIPTGSDFPGLLLMLEDLARASNLQLDSMTTTAIGQTVSSGSAAKSSAAAASSSSTVQAAEIAATGLSTEDVRISVSGGTSYQAVKNFLENIESSRRLLDVISVNFSHSSDTDKQTGYALVLRTYYLPDRQ